MRNKTLLPVFLFFILLTIYSFHIPFFWDGTFFSELSLFFYENSYNGFIAPREVDTGGFPLFSVYLATLWKIAGKTLTTSHIALLPFLLGISYEFFKLAKRFLNEKILPFAMLLLIAEPTFIAQSMLMGYDILMLYFFLLALNALLDNKLNLYRIGLFLLCMSNMRGIILSASLLLIDLGMNYSASKKLQLKFSSYFTAIVGTASWAIYHWQQTGWFFFSPERQDTHEALLPAKMIFRQLVFIVWKLVDFGRVALWIFVIPGFILLYKRKNNLTDLKTITFIIFFPLVISSALMALLSNPLGHRYFMFTYLILIIASCYVLQQFNNRMAIRLIMLLFMICLISGNLWLYPQRYGNGWDSSLKVLPYFKLKDQMDAYIQQNNLDAAEIGTQFPLIADKRFSHLCDTSYHYTNVWRGPINNYRYFLESNVINTDIPEQIEEVKKEWILLKEFKSGQIYLRLYKNKNLVIPTAL